MHQHPGAGGVATARSGDSMHGAQSGARASMRIHMQDDKRFLRGLEPEKFSWGWWYLEVSLI